MAGISLNGVYNHFIQDHVSKDVTQADAHRKDELRDVYKSIAKINKNSPLYLLTNDDNVRADAIDIKERARQLQSNIFNLSDQEDKSSLNHTSAFTTDEDKVIASYIGNTPSEDIGNAGFEIEVSQLASQQVNTGLMLSKDSSSILPPANYAFDVKVGEQEFEFQFSIYSADKNIDVLQKLEKLINKADIGLSAELAEGTNNRAALQISSKHTGLRPGELSQFEIYENDGELTKGAVAALGLDMVSAPACNAHFSLNGEEKTAISNHFTVGSKFDIHLSDVTEPGNSIHVGVKKDNDALMKHITSLVDNYNSFVKDTSEIHDEKFKGDKLKSEAIAIARQNLKETEALGIKLESDGAISVDTDILKEAVTKTNDIDSLEPIKQFANSLLVLAKEISVNPMKYVDRPVVNYKNPDSKENVSSPYITSEYSGMMFNNYC